MSGRTGVFSFKRYDPAFYGMDGPDRMQKLLYSSCGVMVHEIAHMFGLKHCVYYECRMNGSNSYGESCRKTRYFCPICERKLQLVLGFNGVERFQNLK